MARGRNKLGFLAALFAAGACADAIEPELQLVLPAELALDGWPAGAVDNLRGVVNIAGVLPRGELEIDAVAGTASGTFVIPNNSVNDVAVTVEYFTRYDVGTPEVIVGRSTATATLIDGLDNTIELTEVVIDGAPEFDPNRNGLSSVDDLLQDFDPAPTRNPVDISPPNISFESGVEVGGFTRSFFVLENNDRRPAVVDMNVVLAPGVSIVPLDRLFENGGGTASSTEQLTLEPDEEQFLAVTFAPSNPLFVAGGIAIRVTEASGVEHGALMRVLGNPEGTFSQPPADYIEALPPTGPVGGIDPAVIEVFPAANLFSGAFKPVAVDEMDAGALSAGAPDGCDADVDFGFLVAVPPRYRFSLVLDGLNADVDLVLVELDGTGQPVGVAGESSCSLGTSAESVAYDATQNNDTVVILVGFNRAAATNPSTLPNAQTPGMITGTVQTGMYSVPEFLRSCPTCTPPIESSEPCPAAYGEAIACGSLSGNTTLRLRGHNFGSNATVTLGGVPAVCTGAVPMMGFTEITCLTPAATENPALRPNVTVVVRNQDGQAATLAEGFTYLPPPPSLQSILPNQGPTTGGMTATILGTDLFSRENTLPTVTFAGLLATVVSLDQSAGQLTIITPACQDPGATPAAPPVPCSMTRLVDVEVTNPDGQSDLIADGFTFVVPLAAAPTIATLTPATGSTEGGDAVTITGTGFVPPMMTAGTRVRFRGADATVTMTTATRLDVVTPPGTSGEATVEVLNPDGQTARSTFNYRALDPTVSSIMPGNGLRSGGTAITISGARFQPGAQVRFGTRSATQVVVSNANTIQCVTPPGAMSGPVDVTIQNLDATTVTRTGGFVYDAVPAPTVSGVTPDSGPVGGGTIVFVAGTGFQPGATVAFSGVPALQTLFNHDALLTVTTPAGAAGPANVRVTNPDTQTGVRMGGFNYVQPMAPAPVISAVNPNNASPNVSTAVTIEGANFVAGLQVFFGTQPANVVDEAGVPNQVIVDSPLGSPNTNVTLRLQNPDGQIALASFAYGSGGSFVGSIFPDNGDKSMQSSVLITGSGFTSGVTVRVEELGWSANATQVSAVGPTLLSAVLPIYAGGNQGDADVDIVVAHPAQGELGRISMGFTYTGGGGSTMMPEPIPPFPPCDGFSGETVSPCYNAGPLWNDYVLRSNATQACNGFEAGGWHACLHAGMMRVVEATGTSSCTGVSAVDNLGAMDWVCDPRPDPVQMIAVAPSFNSGLWDLIDTQGPGFRSMSVTVTGPGGLIVNTSPAPWWTNTVVVDSQTVSTAVLDTANRIYVRDTPIPVAYSITANKVALVINPANPMIQHTSAATGIEVTGPRSFLWIEGPIDGEGQCRGLRMQMGVTYSVVRHFTALDFGMGGCDGDGIILNVATDNLFEHVIVEDSGFGMSLVDASRNTFYNVNLRQGTRGGGGLTLGGTLGSHANQFIFTRIGNYANDGLVVDFSDNNSFSSMVVSNAGGSGVIVNDAYNNDFADVTSVSNDGYAFRIQGDSRGNIINGITTAYSLGGISLATTGVGNDIINAVAVDNTQDGLEIDGAFDTGIINLATAHNGANGINLANVSAVYFSGNLGVGNNFMDCALGMNNFMPGITTGCAPADGSDFGSAVIDIDLTSAFAFRVGVDPGVTGGDVFNPHDDASPGLAMQSAITDWVGFDYFYRAFGIDGLPLAGNVGKCAAGNCRIWDWRLSSASSYVRGRNQAPADMGDLHVHEWSGTYMDQGECDTFFPGSMHNSGTMECETLILRNGVEFVNDGVGNDNTLCEAGEDCAFMQNIGAYQGEGLMLVAGPTVPGSVLMDVNLLTLQPNGVSP